MGGLGDGARSEREPARGRRGLGGMPFFVGMGPGCGDGALSERFEG